MTTKKPTRRPRHAYNRRLVDLICERIAVDGVALREICQDTSMPARSTLFNWLRRHPVGRNRRLTRRAYDPEARCGSG